MQSDLFGQVETLPLENASVQLYRQWLNGNTAESLFDELRQNVNWQQPTIWVAGKRHKIPRLQAWYGDSHSTYRYSHTTFTANPWLPPLSKLKSKLESFCHARFNSVLVNLYRNGSDSMGLHADNEPELGPTPLIASITLGASRKFVFKSTSKNSKQRFGLTLNHGDLLIMAGETQKYWLHGLPKTQAPIGDRLNLTFRWVRPSTDRQ